MRGEAPEDVLSKLYATFPNGYFDDSMPHDIIAAVLQLDQLYGIAQDDDRVVIDPAIGMWLLAMGLVSEPARLRELCENGAESSEQESELESLVFQWFKITFQTNEGEFHPAIHDKTLTMRFLREDEVHAVDFTCATVRADGTLIEAPIRSGGMTQF